MTSNLPPDWNAAAAGVEPRYHYHRCRTNCAWETNRSEDLTIGGVQMCPELHEEHTCDCEELAYYVGGVDSMGIWS